MTITDGLPASVQADRRQAAPIHPLDGGLVHQTDRIRVEWRKGAAVEALAPVWRSLAARGDDSNIFQDPDFLLPATRMLDLADRLEAVAAWDARPADADRPRLLGIFPFLRVRPWGVPLTVARAVSHAYGPAGTPAIDSDAAVEVMQAMIDAFAATPGLPSLVSIPYLRFGSAAADALRRSSYRQAHFGTYDRAILDSDLGGDAYLATAQRPKQRKRSAQQRRQLSRQGSIDTRIATGADVSAAADRFLALEASGWKGRRGTAMAARRGTEAMFRQLTDWLGARGQCDIYEMTCDGKTIASYVLLRAGRRGWLWKGAFDEAYARWSPGQLLALDVTRALLDRVPGLVVDSCAVPGHSMINHIFRERMTFADLLLDVRTGGDGKTFAWAVLLETFRRTAHRHAVALLTPLRQLRKKGPARVLRDIVKRDRAASGG